MSTESTTPPKVPPSWFVHVAWRIHRGLYKLSGGRFLWTPANKRGWGAMHLTTTGRRSGRQRSVIVGYIDDGPNLVVVVMNGWQEGQPAWWLNLEANPDCTVRRSGGPAMPMRAHRAEGDERDRLWAAWRTVEPELDGYAATRRTESPVVVFAPRGEGGGPT